jgi:hypothetical protein
MTTYTVDVLHAFPLFPGDSLDGMGLQERTFVESGRHDIRAPSERMQRLEADGYIEIISIDGRVNVWTACCDMH